MTESEERLVGMLYQLACRLCGNASVEAAEDLKTFASSLGCVCRNESVSHESDKSDGLPRMMFGDCAKEFLKFSKGRVKESTYADYCQMLFRSKYAKALEGKYMDELDYRFLVYFADGFAPKATLRQFLTLVNSIRNRMEIMGFCKVAERCKEPIRLKVEVKHGREMSEEDQRKIFNAVENADEFDKLSRNEKNGAAAAYIALQSGLRIGELCALKCGDVKGGKITVTKTLQRIYRANIDAPTGGGSEIHIGPPKSKSSNRSCPVGAKLKDVLERLVADRPDDDTLFKSSKGAPIEVRSIRTAYDDALKRLGIEKINFHSLRHSFVSRMIREGKNPKAVSTYVGHSDLKMTLGIYTHINDEDLKGMVNND